MPEKSKRLTAGDDDATESWSTAAAVSDSFGFGRKTDLAHCLNFCVVDRGSLRSRAMGTLLSCWGTESA